jgi:large subunit ribosomal protein L18
VFRSNRGVFAQLIDDDTGRTLAAASWLELPKLFKGDKTEQAAEVGKRLAAAAKKAGVESVVFDRGGYLYHGRVKALAEGAREGGLSF